MAAFFTFAHSLLRYGVVLFLAIAAFMAIRGLIMKRPLLVGERNIMILALVLTHVQVVIGVILYAMRYEAFEHMQGVHQRFWKFEHIGTMLIAAVLITFGRVLSKRTKVERKKQLLIGVFYSLGLLLILWAIPWPFTPIGRDLGWL